MQTSRLTGLIPSGAVFALAVMAGLTLMTAVAVAAPGGRGGGPGEGAAASGGHGGPSGGGASAGHSRGGVSAASASFGGVVAGKSQPVAVSLETEAESRPAPAKPVASPARKVHKGERKVKSPLAVPFNKIELLAKKGNLYAKWRLAKVYESKALFAQNKDKAFKLYSEIFSAYRSANLYSAKTRFIQESLISIAGYYRTGLPEAGVKKNPKLAYSILKHVALYGHPRAQYLLGEMTLAGEGASPSRKQGMRWLNLAAQKKHAPAQAALGRIYANQNSDKVDRARGLMWLGLARGNARDNTVRNKVSELYESLKVKANENELNRAESLTLGWQQRFGSAQ